MNKEEKTIVQIVVQCFNTRNKLSLLQSSRLSTSMYSSTEI